VIVQIGPSTTSSEQQRRPDWLRAPAPVGENYRGLKTLVQDLKLHTVCESAALPEHRRLLESSHGHVHDFGERVHAAVRVLRGAEGRATGGGLR
jgi:lipoate synthase